MSITIFLVPPIEPADPGAGSVRSAALGLVTVSKIVLVLGLVRAVALLRRGTGASWRDALGAFFIWQSTSLVVARASVLGLVARKAAFLRTPKTSEQAKWWETLRANWAEITLALLGAAGIAAALSQWSQLSGPLLAGLLLFPTLGFAAAPVNSRAAQRAALPDWLRERRRTEARRDRRAFAAGAATGGAIAVVGVVVAALVLMLAPSRQPVQPPNLVGPAQGQATTSASPTPTVSASSTSPTPTPTPTPTPATTSPSPSPSPSVTGTPTPTVTPTTPPASGSPSPTPTG